MDSSHPLVVRYKPITYKIHSNNEEWPCCDICAIILRFIYVHNALVLKYVTDVVPNLQTVVSVCSEL